MKLFDTHCHFESCDPVLIAAQLARAKAVGVERVMAVGGSLTLNESAALAVQLAQEDVIGILPRVVMAQGVDRDQTELTLAKFVPPANMVALGEIGLDYHYSPETRDEQLQLFGAQLEMARERDLPVVIHTREADDDTLALLKAIPSRGIIHCFTGSPEFARRLLDLGFYISISGIVTFKLAAAVRDAAAAIPDDRLLIETDSPFLAPVPMRGNPNEPAFVRHTGEFLAQLRGMSAEALAELTFTNGERCLGLEKK